jgi:hypothetical protein
MAMEPGEAIKDFSDRHGGRLLASAILTTSLVLLWTKTEEPFIEPSAKLIAEVGLHQIGKTAPWENDHNMIETVQQSGTLTMDSYLGSFVNWTEAKTTFKTEIIGQTISKSETIREGFIVSRIRFPGVPTIDWKGDDDVMYITRYYDGQEVGIPLDKAVFEMMQPEAATLQDGQFSCSKDISAIDYTGCVESEPIREGFFFFFPLIGQDQGQDLANAGEMLFDEFAKIEECHFDNVFIPAFNEIYTAYNIPKQIDGPDAYNEVMRTFVRYFVRERIAEKMPPQRVFLNISGSYVPTPSIINRIEARSQEVDFPFKLGEDIQRNYCKRTSSGSIPIAVVGEDDWATAMKKIAIGGLERVPDGFNIQTGGFEDGKYKGASLETNLGNYVRTNVLGGA